MLRNNIFFLFLLISIFSSPIVAIAQPAWTFDLLGKTEKKDEKYENKKLGSERLATKKYTLPRKVYQNTITHYNYFFNANNKINKVVEQAKNAQVEDFTKLLQFYPYSLNSTAASKNDLDSVIITSTAGILLHDLRNNWIDNMYLLIGEAYFFRKDFDSAAMTFQFINYNLFPRKKKNDDDDKVIGTTEASIGSSTSIANTEKRNFAQKIMTPPPSRNDALIWLVRTQIEQGEFGESAGLINTLLNDPIFPKRLKNDLEEVNAYWFFKQEIYDSATSHLEKALSNADTKQDKSRWEFLLAQLFEMNNQFNKASFYYKKAATHTTNPLIEIYAQLNEAKMVRTGASAKELDKSISNLIRMGHQDKFDEFRDIVYFSAAQLTLQKPDTTQAIQLYNKSLKYNTKNLSFKNKSFLKLADIAYNRKEFKRASAMYDSLQLNGDSTLTSSKDKITERKNALTKIVNAISKVENQDSLQRIAALPIAERNELIKKISKRLRKENGLKGEGDDYNGNNFNNNKTTPVDLFDNSTNGDFYFYNTSAKERGLADFKSKWGNRVNVDNWRRKSAEGVSAKGAAAVLIASNNDKNNPLKKTTNDYEISFDGLLNNLPLTPQKIDTSNQIIATNLLTLASVYQIDLEEYQFAIDTYNDYLKRFPNNASTNIYLALYFCYNKLGNTTRANYYKNLITTKYANSTEAKKITNPASLNPKTQNQEATKIYDEIYEDFIEGNFDKAIAQKQKADSTFGENYWTPQLLYIEALHFVKDRNDSIAIIKLNKLINTYPKSELKIKAQNMISVLGRRKEIEAYLEKLEVTRKPEDVKVVASNDKPIAQIQVPTTITTPKPIAPAIVKPIVDTTKKIIKNIPTPAASNGTFSLNPNAKHIVLMILDKVDGAYVNEAKNAITRYNNEYYYGQGINITKDTLDATHNILTITSFADANTALLYYDKIKKKAPSEISWLPANKYSFIIITNDNLQILKTNKNILLYKGLLNSQYPNRF